MIKPFGKRARLMQQANRHANRARQAARASKAGFSKAGDDLSQWLAQPAGLLSALGTGVAIGWSPDDKSEGRNSLCEETEQSGVEQSQSPGGSEQSAGDRPASREREHSKKKASIGRDIGVSIISRVAAAWLAALLVADHEPS